MTAVASDIKNLASQYVGLKEVIGENESEEEANLRKQLAEKKKLLQNELLELMEKHNVELSNIEIPQVGRKILKITSESRPNYLTLDICNSAASVSLTNKFLTEMKNSVIEKPTITRKSNAKSYKRSKKTVLEQNIGTQKNNGDSHNHANKNEDDYDDDDNDNDGIDYNMEVLPRKNNNNNNNNDYKVNVLFDVVIMALTSRIRELVEHKVRKVVMADEPKRKSRKVITGVVDEKDLNDVIKKKALQLYQYDSQLAVIQANKKKELGERKQEFKEVEKQLLLKLVENGVYNYCKLGSNNEMRYFHLTINEETELRHVTVTTMTDVLNKSVTEAFDMLKMPKNVIYDTDIPSDIIEKLKNNIQYSLKQNILLYEKENSKIVKKIAINNGRYF